MKKIVLLLSAIGMSFLSFYSQASYFLTRGHTYYAFELQGMCTRFFYADPLCSYSDSYYNFAFTPDFKTLQIKYVTKLYPPNPPAQVVWSQQLSGAANTVAMQTDGNLVIYDGAGRAIWSTGTYGHPNAYAGLMDDGNLVVFAPTATWASTTSTNNYIKSSNPSVGTLTPGSTLKPGQSMHSGNGTYVLVMQVDGNLVLYNTTTWKPLWATYTSGSGNWAVMQADGNLVVYNSSNKALWDSHTSGKTGSYLSLQDDGNLVVYSYLPIWRTRSVLVNPFGRYPCPNSYYDPSVGGCNIYQTPFLNLINF